MLIFKFFRRNLKKFFLKRQTLSIPIQHSVLFSYLHFMKDLTTSLEHFINTNAGSKGGIF